VEKYKERGKYINTILKETCITREVP